MIVLTRPLGKAKLAMLPIGGLVIEQSTQENVLKVKIYTANGAWDVREPFDQIVENVDALIERWGG